MLSHTRRLVERDATLITLSSIKSIGDSRALTLKQQSIIHGGTNNAANNGDQERDEEVAALCSEDLASVDDGREETRTEITGRIDSLGSR